MTPGNVPDAPSVTGPAGGRRRMSVSFTVHPDTLTKLDELRDRFQSSRGRMVDKLTDVLHRSYKTGKLHCIHGQVCQIGRVDLPEIF